MWDLSFLANLHPLAQIILAIAAVFGAVGGGIYLTRKAMRDAAAAPTPVLQPVRTELHFEGPLEMLMREVGRMATALEKAPTDRTEFDRWRSAFNDEFAEVRSKMYQEIDKRAREEGAERNELEKRLREVELELARRGPRR